MAGGEGVPAREGGKGGAERDAGSASACGTHGERRTCPGSFRQLGGPGHRLRGLTGTWRWHSEREQRVRWPRLESPIVPSRCEFFSASFLEQHLRWSSREKGRPKRESKGQADPPCGSWSGKDLCGVRPFPRVLKPTFFASSCALKSHHLMQVPLSSRTAPQPANASFFPSRPRYHSLDFGLNGTARFFGTDEVKNEFARDL